MDSEKPPVATPGVLLSAGVADQFGRMTISTRRFWARPASVSFDAMGCEAPMPTAAMRAISADRGKSAGVLTGVEEGAALIGLRSDGPPSKSTRDDNSARGARQPHGPLREAGSIGAWGGAGLGSGASFDRPSHCLNQRA